MDQAKAAAALDRYQTVHAVLVRMLDGFVNQGVSVSDPKAGSLPLVAAAVERALWDVVAEIADVDNAVPDLPV